MDSPQKKVITYGTYDLFHEGHRRLLERAKKLGDRLIVGVTSDSYDASRGKLNVHQNLIQRIENVQRSGLADEILVEEYEGQKIDDIERLGVDIFAIGSDWVGKFDYLGRYCKVVYLERTKGVSSTQLRSNGKLLKLGIVGTGRIARRMVRESKFVSGINFETVFNPRSSSAERFAADNDLANSCSSLDELLSMVDGVYIAAPHGTHYDYAKAALSAGKHVLCEKPITLSEAQTTELYNLAAEKELVLLEALKTAFAPAFQRMVQFARSGSIGDAQFIHGRFTKLVTDGRELVGPDGGSISELATYCLLPIIKIFGVHYDAVRTWAQRDGSDGVDTFARIDVEYPGRLATAVVGLQVKAEGDLVIGGTRGYVYVPAPWWQTSTFEARFEDTRENRTFHYKFDGDGLRYELAEFASLIQRGETKSHKWRAEESIAVSRIIEQARQAS